MTTPAITDGAIIAAKDEESTLFFYTSNVAQLKWQTLICNYAVRYTIILCRENMYAQRESKTHTPHVFWQISERAQNFKLKFYTPVMRSYLHKNYKIVHNSL